MDNNKIGKFIASQRKELGLTQEQLAKKLFVTDKAVSKWERGLSLPDITLLKKLAQILKVDIADILDGEKDNNKNIDIEKEVIRIKEELETIHKKKIYKFVIFLIILILIIVYILFKNIYLGYNTKPVNYTHSNRVINIGIPKTSFMMKHNDRSYSFKNFRSKNIIENEIKRYLKTLKYSVCNNTIYYYNESYNFSIINYSVKNHILYNTISYEIVDNDYCFKEQLHEYQEKLNGIRRFHTHGEISISFYEDWDEKFVVTFIDGGKNPNKTYEFVGEMTVLYIKRKDEKSATTKILEESTGELELKDNKLYYYRKEIKEKSEDITIPEVSIFLLEDGKMILTDNYLQKYYNSDIILK